MNGLLRAFAKTWLPCSAAFGLMAATATSLAQPANTIPAADAACLGKVWHVYGDVRASSGAGSRSLNEGDPVYVGEHVRTGATSEAVIQTTDAGVIAVRTNSEFVPAAYAAQGRGTDGMVLHLVKGSLRLISGWIAQIHREGVEVNTPTVTIGVRGTDHEPFVLPEDVADSTAYDAGSYDKVNRGSIVLKSSAGEVEVVAGQTGFAPPTKAKEESSSDRVLITLLLPRLLDRVPKFFVPGRFEHDINEYSPKAESLGQQKLQELKAGSVPGCGGPISMANSPSHQDLPNPTVPGDVRSIARRWISHLDTAAVEHNSRRILQLFSRDAVIEAVVLDSDGKPVTTRLNRKEFARSVRQSMAAVQDFRQRRLTLDAGAEAAPGGPPQVKVTSHVVEQGSLNGRDYRVESDETYWLEQQGDSWVAVKARSVQR
jgi:hypothetical protein